MPDYRRILSYLYRYENGTKKDCKGFIKAEKRNDTLKLTIQLQDEHRIGYMNLNLCFYEKEDMGWKIWNLDQISVKNAQEEKILHYNKKDLPEQFDIQDQHGVVLYYQDSLYYGSVWIGEEIPVDLTFSNQMPENMISDGGREQEKTEKTDKRGADPGETASGKGISGETVSGTATSGEEISGETVSGTATSGEGISGETVSGTATSGEGISGKAASETASSREANPEKAALPSAGGRGSCAKYAEAEDQEPEKASEVADKQPGKASEVMNKQAEEAPEAVDMLESIREQAPAAEKIFNSAFYEGYQISVAQLVHLGEEADLLSENQFLLKGYGKYHHLLAGRVRYDGEGRYCIGVPGVYENREKYMAQLYQFPVFLSLTENRVKTGRFGYWLHIL